MWQRTDTTKQVVIESKQYTLNQLVATKTFTVAGREIAAQTRGGWICDTTTFPTHAWCDENSYMIDSHLTGELYIEKCQMFDSTIQCFNGHLKDAHIFYSQLKSDTFDIIGPMTLTALRTMSTQFFIHGEGKMMDCAFHGNVEIHGTFQMITSEWRGKTLQIAEETMWQHVHATIQEATFRHTTCKKLTAHHDKLTITTSTIVGVDLHGKQFYITDGTWYDVDLSLAYASISKSTFDDLLIFSPLGTLTLKASNIEGKGFNVHHEKISVQIDQQAPLILTNDLLY